MNKFLSGCTSICPEMYCKIESHSMFNFLQNCGFVCDVKICIVHNGFNYNYRNLQENF